MRIDDLRLFLAAVEEKSFSAASARFGKSPAAATVAIQRLEADLGVTLFIRSTRSIRLTPEGRSFCEYAEKGLAALDLGARVSREKRGELEGYVRVSAPSDIARSWLREQLDDFVDRHPGISMELIVDDELHDVIAEPVDLALRYGELPSSSLVSTRVVDSHRILVASPAYIEINGKPKKPDDIARHKCLVYRTSGRQYTRWQFARGAETRVVDVTARRIANDGAIVRQWALEGRGVAYKSLFDVADDLHAGRLVNALPGWKGVSAPLNAIYSGAPPQPLRLSALVAHLKRASVKSARKS